MRPLLDILIEWYWMRNLVPKNVPQDLIARLSARDREPFSLRLHPCSVVYETLTTAEHYSWPCVIEPGTIACPSNLNSQTLGFCCADCGFYVCKECAQPYMRRSSRRIPRTAAHQLTVGSFSRYR